MVKAAHHGLDERGYGMSSVRFICGTQDIHRELEKKLTEFLGTEDTILFPSCMDANAGVFEAVLNDQDVIIADRLVHASLVDGIRLCKALQESLQAQRHEAPRAQARGVPGQAHAADRHRRRLLHGRRRRRRSTRSATWPRSTTPWCWSTTRHATGFMGKTGRGTHEMRGVMGRIDIITTTLGKALGGASGGCVSGRARDRRAVPAAGAPLPVLQRHPAGGGGRGAARSST